MLALVVAVTGGALTIGLSQLWIVYWSETGIPFPVGQRQTTMLPSGRSLVYYESPHSVPRGLATLQVWDPQGERTRAPMVTADISFRVLFTGKSGRALWEIEVPEAGEYRFIATNENVLSDDDIPVEDRVVFLKSPDSLAEARFIQKAVMITGGSTTIVLTIVCYLLHLAAIGKRGEREEEQFEGEFELEP